MGARDHEVDYVTEFRQCQACGAVVGVDWEDGVPLRSDDVMVMFPLNGDEPVILHNGCENGSEVSPVLLFGVAL